MCGIVALLSHLRQSVITITGHSDIHKHISFRYYKRITTISRAHLFICQTCSFLNGASVEWIEDQKVPYAVKGDQWVGFDNDRSIDAKVRCRVVGYFSALVWTV